MSGKRAKALRASVYHDFVATKDRAYIRLASGQLVLNPNDPAMARRIRYRQRKGVRAE